MVQLCLPSRVQNKYGYLLKICKSLLTKNNKFFRKDPDWNRSTFLEAAALLNIKPIQAYKWGYHRKQRREERQLIADADDKKMEIEYQRNPKKYKGKNYNKIVEDIVSCFPELNSEEDVKSVQVEHNLKMKPSFFQNYEFNHELYQFSQDIEVSYSFDMDLEDGNCIDNEEVDRW